MLESREEEERFSVESPARFLLRSSRIISELKNRLEARNRWKKLMTYLPRNLEENDLSGNYLKKYTSADIELLATTANSMKTASEYLIDEWTTSRSGRMPTIGDLMRLLLKADLYIPAAYIAHSVLNDESLITRPTSGPGASVNVTIIENNNVLQIVQNGEYPENFDRINSNVLNRNIDEHLPIVSRIKEMPLPLQPADEANPSKTDFRTSNVEIPNFSSLLGPNSQLLASDSIESSTIDSMSSDMSNSFNIPDFQLNLEDSPHQTVPSIHLSELMNNVLDD